MQGKVTDFMQKRFILGLMLRKYRMKKSFKKLYGGEHSNLFPNGFIQVCGRKIILNGERNVLVNTLRFLIKSFITYLYSMTEEKGLSGASSNTYSGVQYFVLTSELFHQRMINQTKVENMLKTISTRLKFTSLIKLGSFQRFFVKYLAQQWRAIQIFRFFPTFCYFNILPFMLSKDCVNDPCIQAYTFL